MPPKNTPQNFWAQVAQTDPRDCWLWKRCTDGSGYGEVMYHGKVWRASRLAWTFVNGAIPEGLKVLHRCDNPPCCNPAHLFLGTDKDNSDDMIAKGRKRNATGLKSGAYTHPESRPRGDKNGSRTHIERRPRGDAHYSRQRPELTARGERSGKAKMTEQAIRDIRQRYANGTKGVALAREYGVNKTAISCIVLHKTWAHVV